MQSCKGRRGQHGSRASRSGDVAKHSPPFDVRLLDKICQKILGREHVLHKLRQCSQRLIVVIQQPIALPDFWRSKTVPSVLPPSFKLCKRYSSMSVSACRWRVMGEAPFVRPPPAIRPMASVRENSRSLRISRSSSAALSGGLPTPLFPHGSVLCNDAWAAACEERLLGDRLRHDNRYQVLRWRNAPVLSTHFRDQR